jgi:hypothetical protein
VVCQCFVACADKLGAATQVALSLSTSNAVVNDDVIGTLTTLDSFGNIDLTINGMVQVDVVFGMTTSMLDITIVSGSGTFTFARTVVGTYAFSLVDAHALGLDVTSTSSLVLSHGLFGS